MTKRSASTMASEKTIAWNFDAHVSHENNISAYDRAWQYPAITEQHAFVQLKKMNVIPEGCTYVAFPWATLIDKIHRSAPDLPEWLEHFELFCKSLPRGTLKFTVCQHIKMMHELHLLKQAEISTAFWSHVTHSEVENVANIQFKPFPLYPVQCANLETNVIGLKNSKSTKRSQLFSFIGARSNQHYLTDSRNLILEKLSGHPQGQVVGRDQWHYNKVVYQHQVTRASSKERDQIGLVDDNASNEFAASLQNTRFSLCPSGSGPNSIRLWESLGFGAVPVVLADDWMPPGNVALWKNGAIFVPETSETIAQIPNVLAEIDKNEGRLRSLQHGTSQLWLLYGLDTFVTDILSFLLDLKLPAAATVSNPSLKVNDFLLTIGKLILEPNEQTDLEAIAQLFVCLLSSHIITHGTKCVDDDTDGVGEALTSAIAILGAGHKDIERLGAIRHVSASLSDTSSKSQTAATPFINRGSRAKVCLKGKHSHRTPLSYSPFKARLHDSLDFTSSPSEADIIITGFNSDIPDILKDNSLADRSCLPEIAVISEEPLWDSIWSQGFLERKRVLECDGRKIAYSFFNHSNSDIFKFEKIPYFVTTRTDFLSRYITLLTRFEERTAEEILQHWHNAPISVSFFAEKRENRAYSRVFEKENVIGLSNYRTDVAKQVATQNVLREGAGWHPDRKRQSLVDWHLDKLATLDGRVRILSAYENTHQINYISEKIFDAFAVGAIPTYYASNDHRVHELVQKEAIINTSSLTSHEAATKIDAFKPDLDFARTWLSTVKCLKKRFSEPGALSQERDRISKAVLSAVADCLS